MFLPGKPLPLLATTHVLTTTLDSETCGEETKVRSQAWRRQTHAFSLQENLEVVIVTCIQNHYQLLKQQIWASLDGSASLCPRRVSTSNQP